MTSENRGQTKGMTQRERKGVGREGQGVRAPGLYPLLAGIDCPGITPGTGLYTSLAQQRAEPELSTCRSCDTHGRRCGVARVAGRARSDARGSTHIGVAITAAHVV